MNHTNQNMLTWMRNLPLKVFSVCQDLVYNSSKERSQTPKSLALAIAVRQLSGCSDVIRILNGLGHCVAIVWIWNQENTQI